MNPASSASSSSSRSSGGAPALAARVPVLVVAEAQCRPLAGCRFLRLRLAAAAGGFCLLLAQRHVRCALVSRRRGSGAAPREQRSSSSSSSSRRPGKSRGGGIDGFSSSQPSVSSESRRKPVQKTDPDDDDTPSEGFSTLRDPLSRATPTLEEDIWQGSNIADLAASVQFYGSAGIQDLLESVMRQYSLVPTRSQLSMMAASLLRSVGIEDPAYPQLEEPLSWRPLENSLGLQMFAFDLLAWRWIVDSKAVKGAKRGFASEASFDLVNDESDDLRSLKGKDDEKFLWVIVRMMAREFRVLGKRVSRISSAARILLPEAFYFRMMKEGKLKENMHLFDSEFAGCELVPYAGSLPTWDHLTSGANSLVLVIQEPRQPADELSWKLPIEASEKEVKSLGHKAPVIVLSCLQHGVKFNLAGLVKKTQSILVDAVMEEPQRSYAEDSAASDPGGLPGVLGPLASMFGLGSAQDKKSSFFGDPFGQMDEASMLRNLRSKLTLIIHKAYSARWARLQEERGSQLVAARTQMQLKASKLKARQEKERLALEGLEEAISLADGKLFENRLAESMRAGAISQSLRDDLQQRMQETIRKEQSPFQDLADRMCKATTLAHERWRKDPEMQEIIETALDNSKLPQSNPWLQAGRELCVALRSVEELDDTISQQYHDAEEASMDVLNNPKGLALAHSKLECLSTGIGELAECLARAEASVERFERSVRTAGRTLGTSGAPRMRDVISHGKSRLSAAKRDDALRSTLLQAPWTGGRPSADAITAGHLEQLEAKRAVATDWGRAVLGAAVEQALSIGRAALSLQSVAQGDDIRALEQQLAEARRLGLQGLEATERRLAELRSEQLRLRRKRRTQLEAAVASLDCESFEKLCLQESSSGLQIPPGDLEHLRKELADAVAAEETIVKELICADCGEEDLRGVLESCRLPASDPWRRGAETLAQAFESANDVRAAMAAVRFDQMALEASLSSGTSVASKLKAWLANELPLLLQDDPAAAEHLQKECRSNSFLVEALDAGYVALSEARADEALASKLASAPWGPEKPHWESVQPSDLDELEARAAEATEAVRERLASELEAALQLGRSALDLQEAMSGQDPQVLGECIAGARDLGLQGLKSAELRQRRLLGRRPLSTAAQTSTVAVEGAEEAVAGHHMPSEGVASNSSVPAGRLPSSDDLRMPPLRDQERCTNLIFIDLELTAGFYDFDQKPFILEAAVIVTDKNLCELERGHWVLGGFTRQDLESLGEFHKANFCDAGPGGMFPPLNGFRGNGLFADVIASSLTKDQVEEEMLELIQRNCPEGECPLVGYSVQCDREVIKDELPRFYRHVSHQIVDVSGFFTVTRMWLPEKLQQWDRRYSTYNHRAVQDAEDAIEALRWVRRELIGSGGE
eukprot:TRINITY_DN13405_c0_g1_i1.p1 TRINITY_DN13405_c0_g1~~TRINITY_DN13405_c0_g1_i1.p1  ORF type:complete len:1391 (+),score=290.36 TRINITY_DN13405_c0_g1_i1:102-4274(+)